VEGKAPSHSDEGSMRPPMAGLKRRVGVAACLCVLDALVDGHVALNGDQRERPFVLVATPGLRKTSDSSVCGIVSISSDQWAAFQQANTSQSGGIHRQGVQPCRATPGTLVR
jgi:hypothetical protein